MKRKYKVIIILGLYSMLTLGMVAIMLTIQGFDFSLIAPSFSHRYSNGLTFEENRLYAEVFRLEHNQNFDNGRLAEPVELFATPETEDVISALRYFRSTPPMLGWILSIETNEDIAETNRRFNLNRRLFRETAEFDLSAEWVLENPRSAVYFIQILPEDVVRRATEMVGELTLKQYINYAIYYDLASDYKALFLNGSAYLIAPTENTRIILELINQLLWDSTQEISLEFEQYISDMSPLAYERKYGHDDFGPNFEAILSAARSQAYRFGFSAENEITIEWIIEEPYLAFQFSRDLPRAFSRFIHDHQALGYSKLKSLINSENVLFMQGILW